MSRKIDYTTIEPIHGKFWFCQRGVYEDSSVLAGQDFRQLVDCYDTLPDAVLNHPEAEVSEYDNKPYTFIPEVAPAWFDPADAGEVWHEDDY